jgi:hypothetical protein
METLSPPAPPCPQCRRADAVKRVAGFDFGYYCECAWCGWLWFNDLALGSPAVEEPRSAASQGAHMNEPTPAKWVALVTGARWHMRAQPTFAARLRCGVCRRVFEPGSSGAPTFIEEGGSILLRTCPTCLPLFTIAARPVEKS